MDASEIRRGIDSGRITQGMHVRDEGGAWSPIETSPFGSMFAVPAAATVQGGGEGLGLLLLLTPLLGALFIGWRVSNMNLFQDPMGSLISMSFGLVVLCAILAAVEASQLRMGQVTNSQGKVDSGPVTWALAIALVFVVAYPWYLVTRSRYGKKNYVVGGTIGVLFFCGVTIVLGGMIEDQKARVRESLSAFR